LRRDGFGFDLGDRARELVEPPPARVALVGQRAHPLLELVRLGHGLGGPAPIVLAGVNGLFRASSLLRSRRLGRRDALANAGSLLLELLVALGERLQLLLGVGGPATLLFERSSELVCTPAVFLRRRLYSRRLALVLVPGRLELLHLILQP